MSTNDNSIVSTHDSTKAQFVTTDPHIQQLMSDPERWYKHSQHFWQNTDSTVNGMLGGYGSLSPHDLTSSAQFLKPFIMSGDLGTGLALDCGAGIGRITSGMLLHIFSNVEMLDTVQAHLDQAQCFMGDELYSRVSAQHCVGLEGFKPRECVYDVVWIQWVIIYLSDSDFISLLTRLKSSLKPGGIIVIKDNVGGEGCELDSEDSSVMRNNVQLEEIFRLAGVTILKNQLQIGFPQELQPVRFYALQ